MRPELDEHEYQVLLDGVVGDLTTYLDMFFTADWRDTKATINRLGKLLSNFKGTWEKACEDAGYIFRVSNDRRVGVARAIANLEKEISVLKQGTVFVQKRWEGVFSRFCMSAYWFETGRPAANPKASDIIALFQCAMRANENKDSQGLRFIVEARRRSVTDFIDMNRLYDSGGKLRTRARDPLRQEGIIFLETADKKDLDLSGAIFESVRKIAKEWEALGRVPDPSEISPLDDPNSIWLDET